jgi:pectin methylesterase-like acyl-CoA thioesterase
MKIVLQKFLVTGFVCMLCISISIAQTSTKSQWVYPDAKGKLVYKTLETGDKIMDFSYAGYMGGGVKIPSVDVKITLGPTAGDNSAAIQQAIDDVSKMKLANGFRGAVLLKPGVYNCEKTLVINASGVVLRGSGTTENGTVLNLTGKPHPCVTVKGNVSVKTIGQPTTIADSYVPSGVSLFTVANASGFAAGDTIRITRPITDSWIQFMGMDQLVRSGKKQTWISGDITTERIISGVEKNKITVSVPLNDSYDSKYISPAVTVQKITTTGELTQIGIENFRILSAPQSVTIDEGHHRAFTMSGLSDGWARNLEIFNTVNSVSVTGRKITVDNISIIHNLPTIGAAKPADLNGSGQQLLFNRCTITGDNLFFFGTGAKVTGPVVVLNCIFRGNGWIQPHQRWATGLLIDHCEVPDGGIDFMNRGVMGSGHGWAIGWAVAWNCKAKSFLNQQPPGSANWVIGSYGNQQRKAIPGSNESGSIAYDSLKLLPAGIYDSHDTPVTPASLYLSQLNERLGRQAVIAIGYKSDDLK